MEKSRTENSVRDFLGFILFFICTEDTAKNF